MPSINLLQQQQPIPDANLFSGQIIGIMERAPIRRRGEDGADFKFNRRAHNLPNRFSLVPACFRDILILPRMASFEESRRQFKLFDLFFFYHAELHTTSILRLSRQIVNVLFLLGGPQSGNGYQGLMDFFYVWVALQTTQVLRSVFC